MTDQLKMQFFINNLNQKIMEKTTYGNMQEMDAAELQTTNGGAIWPALVGVGIGLLVDEWESTKRAARDLWNFEYNPPR